MARRPLISTRRPTPIPQWPILDALHAFDGQVIEVHLSNVHKRESFRHHSYVSLRADGVIAGLGVQGYKAALEAVMAASHQ